MSSIRQAIVYLLRHDTVNRTVQGSGTATKQSPSFIVIDRRGNYRPYQAILSRGGGGGTSCIHRLCVQCRSEWFPVALYTQDQTSAIISYGFFGQLGPWVVLFFGNCWTRSKAHLSTSNLLFYFYFFTFYCIALVGFFQHVYFQALTTFYLFLFYGGTTTSWDSINCDTAELFARMERKTERDG